MFEYLILDTRTQCDIEWSYKEYPHAYSQDELDHYGLLGWEMIACSFWDGGDIKSAIFKRTIIDVKVNVEVSEVAGAVAGVNIDTKKKK